MSFTPLKYLINDTIKRAKINEQIEATLVFEYFNKAIKEEIGEKALSRMQAKYLKDGVLKIAVLSSALSSEIKLHEEEIIEKINNKFGKKIIKKLQFF
jgi:predicted nucleic acid-binding Zn ribbon protein